MLRFTIRVFLIYVTEGGSCTLTTGDIHLPSSKSLKLIFPTPALFATFPYGSLPQAWGGGPEFDKKRLHLHLGKGGKQ